MEILPYSDSGGRLGAAHIYWLARCSLFISPPHPHFAVVDFRLPSLSTTPARPRRCRALQRPESRFVSTCWLRVPTDLVDVRITPERVVAGLAGSLLRCQARRNRKSVSIAPGSARGPLVEGRDTAGVERGTRTPRRREAPSSHMVKLILKSLPIQMENYCDSTRDAPRAARESLAELCENLGVGKGTIEGFPLKAASASAGGRGLREAPPRKSLVALLHAEITHFDGDCAEVRAGAPSRAMRPRLGGGGRRKARPASVCTTFAAAVSPFTAVSAVVAPLCRHPQAISVFFAVRRARIVLPNNIDI
ncbi:hypothetical protein FB107DRAFT_277664 [Schizophyllum commune]